MIRKTLILLMLLTGITSYAQVNYTPSPENLKSREWFQDAKLGMFIHWGVYSILGDGEWVMNNQRIDKQTYQKLPSFFNPINYDPKEWVALAKAAGMKYITITSKHHDGFAMFDSKLTDWDIIERTPYKKDVIKMLADECKKEGIKLFFYHSQLDWFQENYFPRGNTGQTAGRPDKGDWYKYLDFMDGQLTELLTNYGEIGGIWFDGHWDKKDSDWRLDKTYGLIHSLQPACLIGSNHHLTPFPGEDFQMFEKDLPGQKTTGFNQEQTVGQLPLETCETMNNSWGFNLQDKNYKSTKNLIQYIVKAAGLNSNFLLNVGPMPNGKIQPEFVSTLKEIGSWINKNGETIYGTRGGPVTPRSWGVTTQKGNKVYVHILNPEDNNILIPDFGKKIRSITTFGQGVKIKYKQDAFGIAITVPDEVIDETDTILVIEL
ncbi:MAG TPA: alpha-L-fucosidase [Bacteroidales bacterium]|nr:alpha-L-fucosidase [Bacteroidales bacterium]HQM70745.1 alpha-L-fucosidase [Bacteroidales bacterium]